MEQLIREGKISYVGSSNFAAWDVALAQSAASARHFMGLTSEQSLYNLARAVELELIPALRSLGIGLIPYSPLHAGLLTGVLEPPPTDASPTTRRSSASRRTATSSKRMKGCAGSWARSRWTWRWLGCWNPVVSTTIVGATTIEELQSDLGALSVLLDARSRNDSTESGRGRGKPRRRTPGEAGPRHLVLNRLVRFSKCYSPLRI